MVAVVAGNSLGLNTSSARTLGSGGYLGVAGNGRGGDSIYVNAATGNLVIQRADDFMLMPGATDFALTNTYNSLGLVANSFDNPDTWQLSGSKKIRLVGTLNTAGSQIIRTNGDGSEQTYNFVSADLYVSTDGDGAHDTVTRNTSTSQWTWMSDTGEISETYYSLSSSTAGQPAGWIFEARDLNGQLLAYTYNTSNRLTAINNVATGESLTFVYSGANVTQVNASVKKVDLVTGAVTTVTVTRVRYGYDASNRLQTITTDLSPDDGVITDNNTYVTTFAYNPNGLVSSITEKDGSSVTFNYVSVNSAWRVQQVIVTNGTETRTTTFAYNTSTRITKITDPVGLATDLEYDTSNRLIRVRSPDSDGVIQEMLYGYDASGNVTSITDPKGNVTTLQYDSRGNLTLQRDAAGNTVTRIFNTGATTESAKNLLLSETVYLTPDPDGAGAGTASNPLVTRYIYDSANNLRYVVTNEGRVTEYLQEGANVTDPTANSGRKRVAKLEYTVTRYAVPASATATLLLSDLTTWRKAAGTNRSAVLRTDYTYDTAERLQKATDYANADTSGNGIVDGKESVTQFVYDAFGRLLKTVDGVGNTTLRTYDGLGRMLTNTLRASGQSSGGTVTTMSYDDVGNRTLVTLANGLITTSLYNKAGDLISVTNTGPGSVNLGVTQYFYDLDGRLRMVQDPTGQRQHTFWNAEGQKIAEVDGDGTLTEYVYDNDNRVVKSIRYATLVNTSTLVDGTGQPVNVALATLRTAANTQPTLNQINRVIYDTAGRVVYTVDGDGAVVNLRYDGASRLTDSYAYADKVTISSSTGEMTAAQVVTALTTANASYASSVDNRVSRSFHDMDGRLIGTLDAEGYFVEFTYDGAGKLTQKIAYAVRQTNATLLATGTFAQLKPASVTETTDLRTNYFYDGQGQLIGQFAASTYDTTLSQIQGYFTEIQYYRNGNVSNRIEYATRIVFTTSSTFATLKTAAAGTAHTTAYLYDEFNRVKQVTNFEGTVGLTVYDSVGNVTSSTAASGTTDVLTTQATYDALGRVLQELTPEGSAAILAGTPVATAWAQYAVTYTYDLAGRRISATDQKGNKTLYFYDADGRERYSVNALGEVVESRYNALNQLSSRIACTTTISTTSLTGGTDLSVVSARVVSTPTTDAVTTFAYTLSGRLQSSITAEGATITHVYSAFGQETSTSELIQGSTSLQTTYKYDRRGLLLETHADPTGINRWTINTYDAFGRVTQSTDPNGNNSLYSYDRFGRVILVTDRLTQTAATTYDAFSRVLSVRDRANNTTSYAYNDSTRTVTITTPELVMVATVHNRNGQTLTVTDGRGNVTTYEYDANGQVKRIYDSLGNLEQRTYERTGMRYDTTDANGVVTRLTYNAANRVLTRVVDVTGLALTTTYGYDGQGRVTSVTDERGVVTQTSYDRDGRVTTIAIDPAALNLRTTFQYDKRGSVTVRTEGYLSSNPTTCTYQYDSLGRRIQETTTLGLSQPDAVTQYKYDKNGNLTRKIDARGFSTWYVYDAEDRFRYTVDALGGLTANTYDVEGRLQSTQRYATAISVATFGDIVTFGQVTAPTANAADRREQHVYDKDGREVFTIDSGYGVTKRFYDGNGNVIRALRYATPIASGTYTTVASVAPTTNAQDRDLRTVYDVRNRACFTIDTLGGVTQIKYDAAGNVTSSTQYATINTATIPATPVLGDMTTWVTANAGASDRTTRYWYDSANRVRFTLVVDSTLANDTQGWLTELRYNDATRQETDVVYAAKATIASGAALSAVVTAAAGIASASTDQSTLKTFDKGGRLITLTDALGISESYGYDAVGNRTSFTNKKGNVWTYVYDANHRLVQETSPVVDITTVTESVPGAGVLQSSTANAGIITKITYDAVGNVLTRTEAFGRAEQRVTSYSYDALGRQVTTTFPNLKVYSAPANDELNAGTAVTRQEVTATISSTVTYNALGDAVVGLDVDGRYSHKAYDTLGRLKYEVDALNYVTEYVYDSFGNRLQTKRYAAALNTTGLTASAIWTSANILAGITSGSGDRVITSEYDNLNRATRVLQPAAFNFDSNVGSAGGTTNTSSAETKYEYNAFGDVTRQRQLFNASTVQYADTWFYYDRRGLKTAQVDPLKYLMIFEYDETGDLKRQVEYAKAVTGTVNASSYGTVTTTTPQNSPGDAAGYDRETLFAYDRLNRKTSQTLVNVEYTTISGTTTTSATGNQVTTFGYDAVGNQTSVTDPAGSVTYTYYDVLGRVVAIAEPVRDVDGSATTTNLIPLTLMKRDAYGNLVEQVRYANGATVAAAPTTATPLNFTAGAVNASDRTTRLLLDNYGHALRTQDAAGASRYASYNKRGDVAKEWQYTTNADGATETLVTIHQYDALGRELAVVEPQKLGGTNVVVTTAVQYNAFGEVIRKGVNGGQQEYFDYDTAGRVWRTNSGDGVNKVYLYNLNGQVTAEIRSQNRDLSTYVTSASAAYALPAADQVRTETAYDLRGGTVEQRLPTFSITSGLDPITATFTIGNVSGPANPSAIYQQVVVNYGYGPITTYIVNPTATLAQGGGYYSNGSGQYVQDPNHQIVSAVRITWGAPSEAGIQATFEFRVLGSSDPNAWSAIPVGVLSGNTLGVNVQSLTNTTYEYRARYKRPTEAAFFAEATGSFRVDGTTTSSVSISQSPPDPAAEVPVLAASYSNAILTWTAPTDTSVTATFRIKPTTSGTFTDVAMTRSGANFTVNLQSNTATAGTYDFEVVYTRAGSTIAKRTGQLSSNGQGTLRTVTSSLTDTSFAPTPAAVATVTSSVGGQVGATIASSQHQTANLTGWAGTSSVVANWANIGSGQVKVELDYTTQDWEAWNASHTDTVYHDPVNITNKTFTFATGTATTGATLSWTTTGVGQGGITAINAIRVYREMSPGVWSLVYSQTSPTAVYGRSLSWASASGVAATFEYAVQGTGSWTSVPIITGSTFGVDLNAVANGTYDYRITYRVGNRMTAQKIGVLTITSSSVSTTVTSNNTYQAALIPGVTVSSDTISWSYAMLAGSTVTVRYTIGGTLYTKSAVGTSPNFSMQFAELPTGTSIVAYNIDYYRPGETDSYARASGSVNATVTLSPIYPTLTITSQQAVYPSGLQQIAAPTDLGSNFIGWTTAASGGATILFQYQPSGGGTWTTLPTQVNGTGYKVDLTSAAAGTYNYYIAYTASGQVNPYAVARGTFTITRTSSITGFTVTPNAPASPATSTAAPRLQQTFDRWGNVLSVTDAANQTTNYRYNQFGAQVEVKQPSLTVYSTAGGTLATTIQRPTSYNYYDNLGRLIGVRDANGNLTKAALNAAGQVLTENHPDSGVKTFTMNIFGNQTVVTDELGFRTWSTYNGVDLLTAIQHEVVAGGQTYTETYSYDGAGRRISFTNGENETTKYFYDLLGNVVTQRSALNNSTTYEYDTQNRKTKETNAIAGYQTWTYNYFGRLDSHRDLGAIVYTYTYNSANLLTAQTSTGGENQSYTYDAAGHLTQINDTPAARVTTYAYDTAGRRAREKTKINNISTQDTAITYDALGHLSKLTDLRYSLTYLYDAQGNRTNINAVYYDHDQAQKTQDLWYTYDSMNRVLVSQGVNTLGAIGINTTQGIQLTYDLAGQRKTAYTYGTQYIQYEERDVWNPNILDDVLTINYNLLSRYYTDYFSYDGVGRLTKIERDGEDYSYFQGPSGPPIINVTQHRFTVDTRTYDNASRQTSGSTAAVESNDLAQRNQTSVFDDDGRLTSQTTTKSNGTVYQTESVVTYNNDAASVLRGYTVQVYNTGATNTLRYTSTYSNNYRLSDSYQDAGQTVSSSGTGAPQNGSTTRSYNADNELISFTDSRDATKNRYFENSQTGQPLLAVQGNYSTTAAQNQAFSDALSRKDNATRSQYFFFANGQAVGSFGQLQDSANAFKANFDVNYTPVSSDYPASVPTQVIAQQNETLRTIAARVYGDASLWYLIAEENGLTNPDALLESGTALRIPNEVVSLSNSSTSFKPFDVRQAIGDTTPTQPAPKPKKGGCGILGQILILVVAIVATVFTAGALAAPIGSSLGTIMAAGSSVMLGGVTVAGVTAVGTAGAFFATAAVAGAVGSIVSQGVAIAIGAQDSFSWKQVALAGIQAGVGAGLGASGFAKAVGKDLAFLGRAATPATIGVTAATSNALVQGIAVATGVQSQFSWRNVAISAVSAPIAHYGGNVIGNFFGGGTFATGVASSVVGASVRSAFGGKIDVASVLADAFGNALANSVVRAIAEDALVRRQNAMRAQLAESNPDLLGMYDRFIRSGGDPAAFDAVVRNETSRNALTNLAQLEASADHIVASGVDTKDVWTQELGQPDGADGYTLDIDGKPTRIQNRETYGMQALNALADLQVGINELRETVPIDQLIMAAQVAVMGPAAFALDYAKGLLVESIAGDYIRSGVNGFATVLNAGAHETNYDTVRFLLENRNRFEEMWSDSYDLHDELAQRDAGRLIDLSGDLDKSQTGAKLLAAGLLMGTAAMLAMRRGGGQPEVTLPNSTRGWRVGDPVNNLTSAGNVPSWATVRSRYWKNEALTNAAEWSEDNVARMQSGLAPQRMNPYTGELESMELNHVPAQRDGGLFDVEQVWPDDHAAVDPFRQLGRPPHTPPSGN